MRVCIAGKYIKNAKPVTFKAGTAVHMLSDAHLRSVLVSRLPPPPPPRSSRVRSLHTRRAQCEYRTNLAG